jgi:hypothetical protein
LLVRHRNSIQSAIPTNRSGMVLAIGSFVR